MSSGFRRPLKGRRRHVVLLIALACLACASATALAAATERSQRLFAAGVGRGARRSPATALHRRLAVTDAAHLLAEVIPPAGAVLRSGGAGVRVRAGLLTPAFASAVAYRTWVVSSDSAAVLSFVTAHLPAGAQLLGSASGGPDPVSRSQTYSWPAVAGLLDARLLRIQVTTLAGNRTLLIARSQSQWVVARSPAERVLAGVRDIEVIDGLPSKPPLLTVWVKSLPMVRALTALFDSREILQPGSINCPAETPHPVVTVMFRGGATNDTLALASVSATANYPWSADLPGWLCLPISFAIHGRAQPALAGNVVAPIQRLLHTKLPASAPPMRGRLGAVPPFRAKRGCLVVGRMLLLPWK